MVGTPVHLCDARMQRCTQIVCNYLYCNRGLWKGKYGAILHFSTIISNFVEAGDM